MASEPRKKGCSRLLKKLLWPECLRPTQEKPQPVEGTDPWGKKHRFDYECQKVMFDRTADFVEKGVTQKLEHFVEEQGKITGMDIDALATSAAKMACSFFLKERAEDEENWRLKDKEKRKILKIQERRRALKCKKERQRVNEKRTLQQKWQQDKAWGNDAGLDKLKTNLSFDREAVHLQEEESMDPWEYSSEEEGDKKTTLTKEASEEEGSLNEETAKDALKIEEDETGLGGCA